MAVSEGRLDVPNVNQHVVLRRPPAKTKPAAKVAATKKEAAKVPPKTAPKAETKSELKENDEWHTATATPASETSSND